MRPPLSIEQLNPFVWGQIEEELEKGEFVHVHDEEALRVFILAKRFGLYFVMRMRGKAKVFSDFIGMIEYMEELKQKGGVKYVEGRNKQKRSGRGSGQEMWALQI